MTRRTYTEDWAESYYPSYGPDGVINTDENGLGMITRSNMHVEERYGLPVPWRANWEVFNECCCRVCCGCRPIDGEAKPWPDGVSQSIILRLTTECEMVDSSDGQPHSCDYSVLSAFFDQEWEIERTSDELPCQWRRTVDVPAMSIDCCGGETCGPFVTGGKMFLLARWDDCSGDDPEWPYAGHCCEYEVQIRLWDYSINGATPPVDTSYWPLGLLVYLAPSSVSGVGECTTSTNPSCFQMGQGMDCLEGALSLWYQGANPSTSLFQWTCYDDLVEGPFWVCQLKPTDVAIEMIPPEPEA